MRPKIFFLLLTSVSLTLMQTGAANYEPATVTPPNPRREFRGAWVATVANIDWPSKRGLSTVEQKAELTAMLDHAARLKLNAIIFQVRPACDAMYASAIEPWSEYLTGTMGKAPEPFYDPLAFAVEEAHRRGLELHAWFNPYRALHSSSKSPVAANHVSKMKPHLVKRYGKFLWLDPGEREVQEYSLSVVMDVVKRYDIDGVHFDDYFYPYTEKDSRGEDLDFPDDASWRRFGAGGKLSRADWRRENVNTFVRRVYQSIKATRPAVKFGISPFGIWRPGHPATVDPKAYDAYAKLYADSRAWLVNGWVDYFTPQLYWPIEPPAHSFSALLKWWSEQNPRHRHLWPGMDTTKTASSWKPDEIIRQIEITRAQPGVSGHVHWNMKSLRRNRALDDKLARGVYAGPALVPATPWLDSTPPGKPLLAVTENGISKAKATWRSASGKNAWLWLLQSQHDNEWTSEILPAEKRSHVFDGSAPDAIALSAVDRVGNVSAPASLVRRK
jgi:uncharacterized lipoprotein YddW (UPF0748 family)